MPNLPSTTLGKRKRNPNNKPKIVKVVHRGGGYTLVAAPGSKIGDTQIIDGEVCTIRSRESLRRLIANGRLQEAVTRTCTSFIMDMSDLFSYKTINKDWEFHFDTRRVESMENMFMVAGFKGGSTSPNVRSLRNWDTSRVRNMYGMFIESDFNSPSISGWNTKNVQDMRGMFAFNEKFDQAISGWDTRNVVTMEGMFQNSNFNQAIDRWDTSRVEVFSGMFESNRKFNRSLQAWNTSRAKYMNRMFRDAILFNRPLGKWDVSKVTNMDAMFEGAVQFNQDLSAWNTASIITANYMFKGATAYSPRKPLHIKIGSKPLPVKMKQLGSKKGKSRSALIKQWTNSLGYLAVQAVRRGNNTMTNYRDPNTLKRARKVDRAISQYMRDSGLKTPTTPDRKRIRYLYRGIHSAPAANLLQTGRLKDPGFMAFSRSKSVPNAFILGDDSVIIRIDVQSLPHGIPWLWFSDKDYDSNYVVDTSHNRHRFPRNFHRSNAPSEQEVLLPPGRLILGKKVGAGMYDAVYVPDTRAKSIEKKPIIRRVGPPRLDSKTRQTQMNKHLDQMFRQVLNLKA
jgi:surface protein